MQTTMDLIHRLAQERFELFRLAGHQHLTPAQSDRIGQITNQLEVLWDQERRERVAASRPRPMTRTELDRVA